MDIKTYHAMWNNKTVKNLFPDLEDFYWDIVQKNSKVVGKTRHLCVKKDEQRRILAELAKMYVARQDAECYRSEKKELTKALKEGYEVFVASNAFQNAFGKVDWKKTDINSEIVVSENY